MGADDDSFRAIGEVQDKDGHTGVFLQPTVSKVAQHAFKRNLARLGPLVLPWLEMVRLDAFVMVWTSILQLVPCESGGVSMEKDAVAGVGLHAARGEVWGA